MTAKEVAFDNIARKQIGRGLDALANVVKVTLGPRGRNVLIERSWGSPTVTKDGATVAEGIHLDDHLANLGVQMVKEVAAKTASVAGDGTTTATVLAQAIFTEGVKIVTAGASPIDIKRGIDAAVDVVVAELARLSKPVRGHVEIAQVGTVSANGDETIGALVADAMQRVGNDGVVTLEEANSIETTLEVVEGMQFDRGYSSPYFITNSERMEVVLEDAYVLISDKTISGVKELLPLLEQVAKSSKPLLIVAEVTSDALATLVVNKLRGSLQVCAVKPPGFGSSRREVLEDIAILTGGKALTSDLGFDVSNVQLTDLGRVKTITVDKDTTLLVHSAGNESQIAGRVKELRTTLADTTSEYDRTALQARLAKLCGGVAVIHVGAATESEMKEKKARIDDSLHATRAAVEEGIVAGGGVALLRCVAALDGIVRPGDEQFGVAIVRRALEQPARQIAENAGVEGAVVVNRILQERGDYGYDAASGKYGDLVVAGIIDPTKVVRVALQNAASIASLMLTTEALIVERQDRSAGSHASDESGM